MIPHCKIQCGIAQPILRLFLTYLYFYFSREFEWQWFMYTFAPKFRKYNRSSKLTSATHSCHGSHARIIAVWILLFNKVHSRKSQVPSQISRMRQARHTGGFSRQISRQSVHAYKCTVSKLNLTANRERKRRKHDARLQNYKIAQFDGQDKMTPSTWTLCTPTMRPAIWLYRTSSTLEQK